MVPQRTRKHPAPFPMADTFCEMLWDCHACDAKGLLAKAHRHCPNCGAAQDPSTRRFPEQGQEIEAQNHRFVGRDWRCRYCESPSSAASAFCGNCGAPQGSSPAVPLVADGSTAPPDASTQPPLTPSAPPDHTGTPRQPGATVPGWLVVLGWVLLAVAGVYGAYKLFSKHDETVQLLDKAWARQVNVEHFTAVRASDWCDNLPAGAYGISSQREQRSTRQIEDGQTCHTVRADLGDGTFSKRQECAPRYREEPVYDQRCSYRLNRWQVLRTDRLQGGATLAPAWPTPQLANTLSGSGNTLGAQRLGTRSESYTVQLQSPQGKQWTCEVDARLWTALAQGQTLVLKVRGTGGAVCDSLALAAQP